MKQHILKLELTKLETRIKLQVFHWVRGYFRASTLTGLDWNELEVSGSILHLYCLHISNSVTLAIAVAKLAYVPISLAPNNVL